MYGSIHNHFEDRYDTANRNFITMLLSYAAYGAKKVVVSGHGSFSAFEDVRDALEKLKKLPEDDKLWNGCPALHEGIAELELIPGVEGYFVSGPDRDAKPSHILLFAKDYEGYQSLCGIITQSNRDYCNGKPVITLENLRAHVKKGHLFCTSACIAGLFGKNLGLEKKKLEHKLMEQVRMIQTADVLDEGFIVPEEILSSIACKKLMGLNAGGKDSPCLVKHLLKHRPAPYMEGENITETAKRLLWQYSVTRANKLILETLRKEKEPSMNRVHAPNALELEYFRIRKAALARCEECGYEPKRVTAAKFTGLKNTLAGLEGLLDEEEGEKANLRLHKELSGIFGKEYFFFELQYHGLKDEEDIYRGIIRLAERVGDTKHFIASNDVHLGICPAYVPDGMQWEEHLRREVRRRDIIRFTRFNRFPGDDDKIQPDDYEYYIKDDDELRARLSEIIPEKEILDNAFSNIERVLGACHVEFPKGEKHYPFVPDAERLFDEKIQEGIRERFPDGLPSEPVDGTTYAEKIRYESSVIKDMGYAGYHLIVADYLEYGRSLGYLPDEIIQGKDCPKTTEEVKAYIRDNGITPVGINIGPGRGSAVGSLCCYLLGITDMDPVPYALLFERFLNPSRVSMPDIDSDFRPDIRERCVEYCQRKYGYDCVCGIMTKSYASTKSAIRTAARYIGEKAYICAGMKEKRDVFLKRFYADADGLCREAEEYEKQDHAQGFFDWYLKRRDISRYDGLWEDVSRCTDFKGFIVCTARMIDGCFLNYGQHAAGTVISGDPVTDHLPLMYSEKKKNFETQCNMAQAESKGYLKMDFLGLKNLDIITRIMRKAGDAALMDYAKRQQILADEKIYAGIYSTGLTQGVFQCESFGMKSILRRFCPECFEDLILLIASYRPGPMKYIDELIEEKWYRKAVKEGKPYSAPRHSITIRHEALEEILAPTYGCIIYQEQIMQICQRLAGFSMEHADNIRMFMSKKKTDKLAAEADGFIDGCVSVSGIKREEAAGLFAQMEDFGKYAFNKSHAAVYALISMFTAYLKLYHPAEFFAESLNAMDSLNDITGFAAEMPAFSVRLLAPDLKNSAARFTAAGNVVYFGLDYIKGLSETGFAYAPTFLEFAAANRHGISAKVMEKLIRCGLFDSMEPAVTREDLAAFVPKLYKMLDAAKKTGKKGESLAQDEKWLAELMEKPRLSLEEKVLYRERFSLKKDAARITRKDMEGRLDRLRADVKRSAYGEEESLRSIEKEMKMLRLCSRHTGENTLANRKNERLLLGYVFDIESSLSALEGTETLPQHAGILEHDIPGVGLVVLDPRAGVTPGGWRKVLCCDRNRTVKTLYFKDAFPEDVTEFEITIKADRVETVRKDGKEAIKIRPQAYSVSEIGHTPKKHVFIQYQMDFERIVRRMRLGRESFHPTAVLHCMELGVVNVPCKWDVLFPVLKESEALYAAFDE